jgi:hypothetical protein
MKFLRTALQSLQGAGALLASDALAYADEIRRRESAGENLQS